jgi:hypothetical protein
MPQLCRNATCEEIANEPKPMVMRGTVPRWSNEIPVVGFLSIGSKRPTCAGLVRLTPFTFRGNAHDDPIKVCDIHVSRDDVRL